MFAVNIPQVPVGIFHTVAKEPLWPTAAVARLGCNEVPLPCDAAVWPTRNFPVFKTVANGITVVTALGVLLPNWIPVAYGFWTIVR